MADPLLRVVVRTPERVVFDGNVSSLRVPTETGQVGLRPRSEATVLSIEPGLLLLGTDGTQYAGTAGGLLDCDGSVAEIMTPVAVVGPDLDGVLHELEEMLAAPSAEKEARSMIARLERDILQEVQRGGTKAHPIQDT